MATAVTADDVTAFLGQDDDATTALAEAHVPVVTAFARGYTRGAGFDADGVPTDELAAVVVTACARLVNNPAQLERVQLTDAAMTGSFTGWSLPELAVLHRYRRRAT